MALTKPSDLVIPATVLADYVDDLLPQKSALLNSSIIETNPILQKLANEGGDNITMPFWGNLDGQSSDNGSGFDGNHLIPTNISAGKERAIKIFRAKAFGSVDFSNILSNQEVMDTIANKIASFWSVELQRTLLLILKGVFESLGQTHTLDKSTAIIKANDFIEAISLLGDAGHGVSAIAMHSATYYKLVADQLIVYEPTANKSVNLPTFLGKQVIVDDSLSDNSGVFSTYLFGRGAISYANVEVPYAIEYQRDALGGAETVTSRRGFIMHPKGFEAQTAPLATDDHLKASATWKKVRDTKEIALLQLKHKVV